MKPYPKALLTLGVLGCVVIVLIASMSYVWAMGYERGRMHQADIDYRTLQYLCRSGEAFTVEPHGKFRCMKQTSL